MKLYNWFLIAMIALAIMIYIYAIVSAFKQFGKKRVPIMHVEVFVMLLITIEIAFTVGLFICLVLGLNS